MKSYSDVDEVGIKSKIRSIFKIKLQSLTQVSGEISTLFDDDLEDQLHDVVKASSDPLTGIVGEVLDFLSSLLEYRVCKGKTLKFEYHIYSIFRCRSGQVCHENCIHNKVSYDRYYIESRAVRDY